MAFLANHFVLLIRGHGLHKLVAVDDLRHWLESQVRVCCLITVISLPLFLFRAGMWCLKGGGGGG
jgi:hypothetical protein